MRDFIHVTDLIEAHVLALDALRRGGTSGVYNCGYGRGYSVLEVVAAFERALGRPMAIAHAPRRDGDIVALIADATAIRRDLGWQPKHEDLDFIVKTALDWERRAG